MLWRFVLKGIHFCRPQRPGVWAQATTGTFWMKVLEDASEGISVSILTPCCSLEVKVLAHTECLVRLCCISISRAAVMETSIPKEGIHFHKDRKKQQQKKDKK